MVSEAHQRSNLKFRTNFRHAYIPFDRLLVFADAGNEYQSVFPVMANSVIRQDVLWNQEDGSRTCAASSLAALLKKGAARLALGVGVVVRVRLAKRL